MSASVSLMSDSDRRSARGRDELAGEIERAIRAARVAAPDDRLPLYRAAAAGLVALRETFTTAAGDVDWRGVSYEYRQAVSDIYRAAGLPADEPRHPVKAAIRYHLSNALRERITPDELEAAGLLKRSQREAQAVHYREGSDLAEHARALLRQLQRTPRKAGSEADLNVALAAQSALATFLKANKH